MTASTQETIGPGIYENLPAERYHAIDAVSNSRLSRLVPPFTPAHLRAYIEEPQKQTDAMALGSAVHTCTFEPHLFAAEYMVAGTCQATTSKGLACSNGGKVYADGVWYCGIRGHAPDGAGDPEERGITVLSADQFDKCQRTAAAVRGHARIGKLLDSEGRAEISVVWTDDDTGLLCKGRIDWLTETRAGWVVVDLKTTTDASSRGFERTIADRGYHRQLAIYEDGLKAHGIDLSHLVFAAAVKESPYAVAGYRLSEGAADEGRCEYRALIRKYAKLIKTPRESWESYGDEIAEIALPAWAYGRINEEGGV